MNNVGMMKARFLYKGVFFCSFVIPFKATLEELKPQVDEMMHGETGHILLDRVVTVGDTPERYLYAVVVNGKIRWNTLAPFTKNQQGCFQTLVWREELLLSVF